MKEKEIMIEVQNLCKNFGELEVLKGINQKFTKGKLSVLSGLPVAENRRFCGV